MTGNRLYKYEKLCSRTAINNIFQGGKSAIFYTFRAAFTFSYAEDTPVQFLITIPKKKIRKAVKRVLLRRRVREAYRLNRHLLVPHINAQGRSLKVAFVYLSDELADYATINTKMQALMAKILATIEKENNKQEEQP